MAQTLAQSFYLGPFAVYTSPSGMSDAITGVPYLGGSLHEGDYVDLQTSEAAQWNIRFGSNLNTGRYRLVRLSAASTAANTGFGKVAGWGLPTTVGQVVVSAAGSGYVITATGSGTGTVAISSSAAGGTAATALLTLSGGAIVGAQLTYAGANMTSVPTFTLTSVLSTGSGGSVLAEMNVDPNFVSTFDASALSLSSPRGVFLTSVTAAQITANAWVVIQELGIAPVLVTTASGTPAAGNGVTAATASAVTTNSTITTTGGFMGYTLDLPAASTIVRVDLQLPVRQG